MPITRNVNYRVLYFFHGQQAVVISHGLQKQQERVPQEDIELAKARMSLFRANPRAHTFEE